MARHFFCEIKLNFGLASFAQLTSLRDSIELYINNRGDGSTFTLKYFESGGSEIPFYCQVNLKLVISNQGDAGTIFSQINARLGSLPGLVLINGEELRYSYVEIER